MRIFIGYDPPQAVAYHVLAHSILRRASIPVSIQPVMRSQLGGFKRPRGPLDSTDFSITRFLVPALAGFSGLAVFVDCDMLCQGDVADLATLASLQPDAAVLVVQHDYTPTSAGRTKLEGATQTAYPRKNWSSLMVMRADRCRALEPGYVERASGLELHRFSWLRDHEMGHLPKEWNWLVGEYPQNAGAKMLHYTLGGPWLPSHRACDHADLWLAERAHLLGE